MRELLEEGKALGLLILALFIVAIIGWLLIFRGKSVTTVVGDTIQGGVDIASGLPSVLGSWWRGESESTYISPAQAAEQKRLTDAALARKRLGLGA